MAYSHEENLTDNLTVDLEYNGLHTRRLFRSCLKSLRSMKLVAQVVEDQYEYDDITTADYTITVYGIDKNGTRLYLDATSADFIKEDDKIIFLLKLTGKCLVCNQDFTADFQITLFHDQYPTPTVSSIRFSPESIITE